jgi:type IV secretory pathway VirB6-like protein
LFDGWMRACVQFTVAQMLVFGFLGFFLILIQTTASDVQASTTAGAALTTVGPFLLMCVIGAFLLTQITSIAATIAGGQALGIRRIPWMMGRSARGAQIATVGAGNVAVATFQALRSFFASRGQGHISSGEPAAKAQVRSGLDAARR